MLTQAETTDLLRRAESGLTTPRERALAVRAIRLARMTVGTAMGHPDGVSTEELDRRVNAAAEVPAVTLALVQLAREEMDGLAPRHARAQATPEARAAERSFEEPDTVTGSTAGAPTATQQYEVREPLPRADEPKDDADARAGHEP